MSARAVRIGVLVAVASLAASTRAAAQSSVYEQLQVFSGLLNQIRLNYVDSVTAEHLVLGAIEGMLASLDPHSHFLTATDAQRMILYRGGELGGTGLEVEDADDAVVVLAVVPRSPGDRAGVQPGDRILAINDTVVRGIRAPTISARLIGERGRRVRVRFERGPRFEPETVSVNLRFDRVELRSVYTARTLEPGVGYVRLDQFGPNAARELRDAAERVMRGGSGGSRRLVLDLRGNPGGIVEQAQGVAELFLPRNTLVFRTRGRRRETDREYRTERDGPFVTVPLVVLIDERSASASEAVAGALQDHDRALLMGRRSFGKALMQRGFHVPPRDDAVMLTVGYVLLPSGRLIQRRYQGMSLAQYYALAGRAPGDTLPTDSTYRTTGGRPVRGGGGVMPDSVLPPAAPLPAWWTAAADSGYFLAVADSVAATLPQDQAAREAWFGAGELWRTRLLEPYLVRVRARLGVTAQPDSAVAARMARNLAARAVEVRWGPEPMEDFRLRHDAGIAAAREAVRGLGARLVSAAAPSR